MAINDKSRNLHQPSRLTRDLADKVRVFGLAQPFPQGPYPTKPPHRHWCGTGQLSKLARQNRRLSASGRLSQKSFERTWNGR